jgi:hypothetical protein
MERYIIVEGDINPEASFTKFKEDVNDKTAEGYTPLGSPIVAGGWIIQAMFLSTEFASLQYRFPNPNPLG